jgi:plasmid stabilization system protein ParE
MQIVFKKTFSKTLDNILDYIAKDSLKKSINFNKQLCKKISNIPYMPYKYRKSFYYNSNDIRDLIFKGYTIPYLIDNDNDRIVILDIFKWVDR